MTTIEAKEKLEQAMRFVFEVENELHFNSRIRRQGYLARIAISNFRERIKDAKKDQMIDITE